MILLGSSYNLMISLLHTGGPPKLCTLVSSSRGGKGVSECADITCIGRVLMGRGANQKPLGMPKQRVLYWFGGGLL